MTTYNAVIFDWVGVFTMKRQKTSDTKAIQTEYGIEPGNLGKSLYENEYWKKAEVGLLSDAEFWRLTLRRKPFGIRNQIGVEEFKQRLFKEENKRVRPGMVKLVMRLRERYTIMLITNADDIFASVLRTRFHADNLFDHIVISAEVGVAKPDPEIYRIACRRLKEAPAKCIFIDDSPRNVQAAESIGMTAIEYKDDSKTNGVIKELRRLGLAIGNQ